MVLIPKTKNTQTSNYFRLIGLCNAFFNKIISKVISERLTKVLPNIIHEFQGAFLKFRGAALTDLVGPKLIHQIVHVTKSKEHIQNIAIKLDLSKAFDQDEWSYLIYWMQQYDFPSHLIQLRPLSLHNQNFHPLQQFKNTLLQP